VKQNRTLANSTVNSHQLTMFSGKDTKAQKVTKVTAFTHFQFLKH